MPTPWMTDNHYITDDHTRLRDTMRALRAVMLNCHDKTLLREAIAVTRDSVVVHFDHEEATAAGKDLEIADILREDHAALLAMIDRLRGLADAKPAERAHAIGELFSALDKHEREVDLPLFRLMGYKSS